MEPNPETLEKAIGSADEETAGDFIVLEPHWPTMMEYFGTALSQNRFEQSLQPIVSFVEIVIYVHETEPAEFKRIMDKWTKAL
jgi:hypothetical protein